MNSYFKFVFVISIVSWNICLKFFLYLGICNFDGGFCEWINLFFGDEFDWILNSGSIGMLNIGLLEDYIGYKGLIL